MSLRQIFEDRRDLLLDIVDKSGKRAMDLAFSTPEMLDDTRSWSSWAEAEVRKGIALAVVGEREPATEAFTWALNHCNYGVEKLLHLNEPRHAFDLWELHQVAFVAEWFLTGQQKKEHLIAGIPHRRTHVHEQQTSPFLADHLAEYILTCLEVGAPETAVAAYGRIKTTIRTVEAALKGKPTTAKTLYLAILHQTNPDTVPADLLARRLELGILTAIRSGAMESAPDLRRIVVWLRLHSRLIAPEPDPWKLMPRLMHM